MLLILIIHIFDGVHFFMLQITKKFTFFLSVIIIIIDIENKTVTTAQTIFVFVCLSVTLAEKNFKHFYFDVPSSFSLAFAHALAYTHKERETCWHSLKYSHIVQSYHFLSSITQILAKYDINKMYLALFFAVFR